MTKDEREHMKDFGTLSAVETICGTSVEDGLSDIANTSDAGLLRDCLQYESNGMNRKTMIRGLERRIRTLERGAACQR